VPDTTVASACAAYSGASCHSCAAGAARAASPTHPSIPRDAIATVATLGTSHPDATGHPGAASDSGVAAHPHDASRDAIATLATVGLAHPNASGVACDSGIADSSNHDSVPIGLRSDKVEIKKEQGQGGGAEQQGGKATCECPKCGQIVEHPRGNPCNQLKCPECGASMGPPGGEHGFKEKMEKDFWKGVI